MFCFFTCKVILQCKSFNFITREIFLALGYSGVFSQKGWRTRDPSSLPEQGRVSQASPGVQSSQTELGEIVVSVERMPGSEVK